MLRDRYAVLGGWVRDQSTPIRAGVLLAMVVVFVLVVQPLARASESIGRENPAVFFLAGLVTIVLFVTVAYVAYVSARSLVGDVRGRGRGE